MLSRKGRGGPMSRFGAPIGGASTRSAASARRSWKRDWTPRCAGGPGRRPVPARWMGSRRRIWWPCCAAPFPVARRAGRCASWPTTSCNWPAASRSPAKPCGGRSKKNALKPWRQTEWCIPPEQSGEFVAHMEDVLDVYVRPYDPRLPQVCMDETSKQLVGETRVPVPAAPGRPVRHDYEYERHGVSNLFLFVEPLRGWRHVTVTERRTKQDWAHAIKDLVDVHYPEAERIVLVLDNLNTHGLGSLYEAFPAEEARRLSRKLELHYTPKHGSWLNIAEIELSVLSSQCLDRRIPQQTELAQEVAQWTRDRNASRRTVDWRFTTADARIKLKRLYPSL